MPEFRQVAVIIDATRVYHRKMLPGITDYANEVGNWQLYVEEGPQERLPDFRTWDGHGILAAAHNRNIIAALEDLSIPIVKLQGSENDRDLIRSPSFSTDNESIGRMGAEHFLDQGFSSFAFCGFPRSTMTVFSHERADAFRQRVEEAEKKCDIYNGRHLYAKQWREMQQELGAWLLSLEKPVGLMAANDARARHVLEACRIVGLHVPEDVAILGVDNDELLCEAMQPHLSSIEQGAHHLGYEAAAILDRMMHGKRPPRMQYLFKPEKLVKRQSTDTMAFDDPEISEAVRFIRAQATQGMQVQDVIDHMGMSRSSLAMKFKAALGRSVHDEIRRVQLEHACHLIEATDLPLKLVALRSGFSHIQHMTNAFRQLLAISPADYRRRALANR